MSRLSPIDQKTQPETKDNGKALEKTIAELEKAINGPEDFKGLKKLARAHADTGNYQKAIDLCNQAKRVLDARHLHLSERYVDDYYQICVDMGFYYLEINNQFYSSLTFSEAQAKQPHKPQAYLGKARAFREAGRYNEAIKLCELFTNLDNLDRWTVLGVSTIKEVHKHPNFKEFLREIALSYKEKDGYSLHAISYLNTAINLDKNNPLVHRDRALSHVIEGDCPSAQKG